MSEGRPIFADGRRPRAPDGVRLYAVGDVHGRLDLLERLFELIDADRAAHPGRRHAELLLGDLIDRGPDSRGVVEAALRRQASHGLVALRGNHDQFLLDALEKPASIALWTMFGGIEALASYGVKMDAAFAVPGAEAAGAGAAAEGKALSRQLLAALPSEHRAFFEAMPLSARFGDLFCVHAGIRPGVAIEAQEPRDLMNIREPFQSDLRDHGVLVIHGHTPVEEPVIRANRIDIDTKAFASGRLTCLVYDGEDFDFLVARG